MVKDLLIGLAIVCIGLFTIDIANAEEAKTYELTREQVEQVYQQGVNEGYQQGLNEGANLVSNHIEEYIKSRCLHGEEVDRWFKLPDGTVVSCTIGDRM